MELGNQSPAETAQREANPLSPAASAAPVLDKPALARAPVPPTASAPAPAAEYTSFQQTPPAKKINKLGVTLGIAVIVGTLLVGALYFWGKRLIEQEAAAAPKGESIPSSPLSQ